MPMTTITIETTVQKDLQTVWDTWNTPEDIMGWMHAQDDWECTQSVNDLRVGGELKHRLGAKDKSTEFDLVGTYTEVVPMKHTAFTMADGRKVAVDFEEVSGGVRVVESFETEDVNSDEKQRAGWQAILENFRKYTEGK